MRLPLSYKIIVHKIIKIILLHFIFQTRLDLTQQIIKKLACVLKRYRSFKPPPIPRSFFSLNIHLNISVFEGKFVVPHGSTYLPLTFLGFCSPSFSMLSYSSLLSAILDTANRRRILSTYFGKCFAILRQSSERDDT